MSLFETLSNIFSPSKVELKKYTIGDLLSLFRQMYTTDEISNSLSLQYLYCYLARVQSLFNDSYVPTPGSEIRASIKKHLGIELPNENPF
jgi:hypothetical protein